MDRDLARRVRSAAVAGWWALLIATIFLAGQWAVYLVIIGSKPAWMLSFWGGGEIEWGTIQAIWLWMTAVFKVALWVAATLVIWLSLWARRLARP